MVAKNMFNDARYDETTKTYSLNIGNTTVSGLGEVSGMTCKFYFEDGNLSTANIVLTIVAPNLSYDMDFEFGGVTITEPEV